MVKKINPFMYYRSPIGWLKIKGNGKEIVSLGFVSKRHSSAAGDPLLKKALDEIDAYFKGTRTKFRLQLKQSGTVFQQEVWRQLRKIPSGKTVSYQKIAELAGRPRAVRAAANALGKNRIAILLPCHRVIASNGDIAGYTGGVQRKLWLLNHEEKMSLKISRKPHP